MTVEQLRRSLEGVDNSLEVIIIHDEFARPDSPVDWAYYVEDSRVTPESSISNTEFTINAGKGFAY